MPFILFTLLYTLFTADFLPLIAEEIGGVTYTLDCLGEKWKIGHTYKTEHHEMTAYIPEKELPNAWSELITVQEVKGLKLAPRQFFSSFMQQLEAMGAAKQIHSAVKEENGEELFAEWWIDEKSNNDQHEWVRLLKKGDRFVILRYTTKNVQDLENARSKAMAYLGIGNGEKQG